MNTFFLQNKRATGGDIAYYPDAKGNFIKLKKACEETYHCMGFSMNGELKGMIRPIGQWMNDHTDFYVIGKYQVDTCEKEGPEEGGHVSLVHYWNLIDATKLHSVYIVF